MTHKSGMRRMSVFDIVNDIVLILLCFLFLYPLWMTLMLSFSDAQAMVGKNVSFWPVGFTTNSYKRLLSDSSIWRYYGNTILYAASGTAVSMLVTSLLSYPLTFQRFRAKKLITVLLMITMFIGGGLIPTYLTIKSYGMMNSIWAIILPGTVSAWNVMIYKTFFLSIPDSLKEAAFIDGAGHFRVLFRIVLPLSKALLATMALFSIVGYWNSYFSALIYLDDTSKMPIQIFLRRILVTMEYKEGADMQKLLGAQTMNPRTMRGAATIVTMLPILCVYPFCQKYFAKGVMIGSVKA